jgi:PAS domain S-box-containing protein
VKSRDWRPRSRCRDHNIICPQGERCAESIYIYPLLKNIRAVLDKLSRRQAFPARKDEDKPSQDLIRELKLLRAINSQQKEIIGRYERIARSKNTPPEDIRDELEVQRELVNSQSADIKRYQEERQTFNEELQVQIEELRVSNDELRKATESLKESEARLAADLNSMIILQRVSTRFVQEGDLDSLLDNIMGAAIDIAGADKGTIQLIRPDSESLDIVAKHGFDQYYIDFFSAVSHGTAAVCGNAYRRGERVIVADVTESPIFIGTPALDVQLKAGVRAVQSTPIVNSKGRMIGILSTHWGKPHRPDEHDLRYIDLLARQVADIIERNRTEEALRTSERLYRAIGESIDYGVWVCAPDGRNIYASESFLKLVGMTQQQISDFGWGDVLHPDDAERTIAAWKACVRTGGTWDIEHRYRGADGKYHPILARGVPVRDEQGKIISWAGINLDISGIKRTEEALKAAKMQAELYVDLMGHDINNMNHGAMGYLELALETLETENRLKLADKVLIEKPMNIMANSSALINNVRKLQQLMAEGIKTRPTDLHKIFRELEATSFHLHDRDVTINFPHVSKYKVKANELLKDVFFNLITNAIKHSDDEMPLTVSVKVEPVNDDGKKYYRCAVEDDGPGIPDELKGKLFHRFQRGATKAHGKGLGLYLVRTLVEGYGGKVWAEDRVPGDYRKGARFIVQLPAVD